MAVFPCWGRIPAILSGEIHGGLDACLKTSYRGQLKKRTYHCLASKGPKGHISNHTATKAFMAIANCQPSLVQSLCLESLLHSLLPTFCICWIMTQANSYNFWKKLKQQAAIAQCNGDNSTEIISCLHCIVRNLPQSRTC